VRQLRFTGIFLGLLEEGVVHGSTVFSVTLFPVIMFIYTGRAYREALGMIGKFGPRWSSIAACTQVLSGTARLAPARRADQAGFGPRPRAMTQARRLT
jgi:hypothetical protein